MNKSSLLILMLLGVSACASLGQSASQMKNSFTKLIVFKKHVTAQERRVPKGNKQYVEIQKVNQNSNYENNAHQIDKDENKIVQKSAKKKLFKKTKSIDLQEKKLVSNEPTENKNFTEKVEKSQRKKSKLSSLIKTKKSKDSKNNIKIDENKPFPDLHSVPKNNTEALPKKEMQQDLNNLQNEAAQIKDKAKKLEEVPTTNFIHAPVQNDSPLTNVDMPKILNEVDESGIYMKSKKPASSYIGNTKSTNKMKLLPNPRYSN